MSFIDLAALMLLEPELPLDDGKKYRIEWRSLITDASGHGDYCLTQGEAKSIVKQYNSKYSGIVHHWFAAAPEHDSQ